MVNVQNAGCYFAKLPKIDAIRACKLIAQQLILNKYIQNTAQSHRKHRSTDHKLVALPTFQKFKKSTMVQCKDKYQKWNCSCKAARVRSYCSCSPGIIQCVECYATHRIDIRLSAHLKYRILYIFKTLYLQNHRSSAIVDASIVSSMKSLHNIGHGGPMIQQSSQQCLYSVKMHEFF